MISIRQIALLPMDETLPILFFKKKVFSEKFFPGSELTLSLISGILCCRISLITEEKLGAKFCKERFEILPI